MSKSAGDPAAGRFDDRRDAGRRLAEPLAPLAGEQPVVVALPRGGVPVARAVADALGAPLEILAVRKLGAPHNPEYGIAIQAHRDKVPISFEADIVHEGRTYRALNIRDLNLL